MESLPCFIFGGLFVFFYYYSDNLERLRNGGSWDEETDGANALASLRDMYKNERLKQEREARKEQELKDLWGNKVNECLLQIFRTHSTVLLAKRRNLVQKNEYGIDDFTAFKNELGYFFDTVCLPSLKDFYNKNGRPYPEAIEGHNCRLAFTNVLLANCNLCFHQQKSVPVALKVPDDPYEYEHFCAQLLNAHGWTARATRGSGDQGADVIAEKGHIKLVIQCKKHKAAINNKAVQEALSGKGCHNGTHAAVVADTSFTRSAKHAAQKNGVLLLHHDQLKDLSL